MSPKPSVIPPRPAPEWFREAKLGMFIHWGIYSVLGHGEQPLFREFLNPSEYRALADRWRPDRYNPEEWAAVAKDAEMKYMVLTARHHDAFCLWDTATTDYNSVRRGPKRDLVADYVRACRRAGLRVGLYYSIPDWTDAGFMGGPEKEPEAFRACVRKIWRQLEELVTQYGRIDLLWFDAALWPTAKELRSTQLVAMLRKHQPGLLINNRLPKPACGGDWGYETPEQRIGKLSFEPWESCMTASRNFWGYHVCHEDPGQWRSEREILTTFVTVLANGGNLLLNVGPHAGGALPRIYRERAALLGRWIRANRGAVYGIRPLDHEFAYGGVLARKGNEVFLYFLCWPGPEYSVHGFNEKLLSARFLGNCRSSGSFPKCVRRAVVRAPNTPLVGGKRIRAAQEPHRILLKGMPRCAPDLVTTIVLTFDAPPTTHAWSACRLHRYPMPPLRDWLKL